MTGSRDMQFRGISDGHRDALVKQSLSLGIEQLDIVASWPKRERLGFVRCRGETAVNVHRRVLSLGFDFHPTVVRRHVVGQIRVIGICPGKNGSNGSTMMMRSRGRALWAHAAGGRLKRNTPATASANAIEKRRISLRMVGPPFDLPPCLNTLRFTDVTDLKIFCLFRVPVLG